MNPNTEAERQEGFLRQHEKTLRAQGLTDARIACIVFGMRLRAERRRLKMTSESLARGFAISIGEWLAYEAGDAEPGLNFLTGLSLVGFDLRWLLTDAHWIDGSTLRRELFPIGGDE